MEKEAILELHHRCEMALRPLRAQLELYKQQHPEKYAHALEVGDMDKIAPQLRDIAQNMIAIWQGREAFTRYILDLERRFSMSEERPLSLDDLFVHDIHVEEDDCDDNYSQEYSLPHIKTSMSDYFDFLKDVYRSRAILDNYYARDLL